jgi:hypothetical protein
MSILTQLGCATYRATVGWEATDLSWLHMGTKRKKVERKLGPPLEIGSSENGIFAVYNYDRGYVPPVEKDPKLKKWLPVVAVSDVGTAGMLGALTAEQHQCQRGLLRVMYNEAGRTIAAKECPGIWGEDCGRVRASARPSTLDEAFKVDSPEEVGCDYKSK